MSGYLVCRLLLEKKFFEEVLGVKFRKPRCAWCAIDTEAKRGCLRVCEDQIPKDGCFFFNDAATTEIYTLSLHDALPISCGARSTRRSPRSSAPASARRSAA